MKVTILFVFFVILAVSTGFAEASHKNHKSMGAKSIDFPSLSPGMFSGDLPSGLQNAAGSSSNEIQGSEDGEQGFDGEGEDFKHHRKSSHKSHRN